MTFVHISSILAALCAFRKSEHPARFPSDSTHAVFNLVAAIAVGMLISLPAIIRENRKK